MPGGRSAVWHLRLTPEAMTDPLDGVESVVRARRAEADEFYAAIHPPRASADEKLVQRQALAGMLWTKQIYLFDVNRWLDGDNPLLPPPESRRRIRNASWRHLNSMRILSMPDKWEYPWFAAWDLAFHCVAIALVDPAFAKDNLWLLLFEQFQHPNGQIPAYEWEFSDLNPPVHAWACWRVYQIEKDRTGTADAEFLEKCFQKLLINFAWWVNKVDSQGLNVFEGGFLGLDNITVVDRSEKLLDGAILEQSDATGWMGFFCLHMMRIAIELAAHNRVYEAMATKFFQHFIYIGGAMKKMGGRDYQLWDEDDGFFYDVLRLRDGSFHKFAVRSLVGLIPLFAIDVLEEDDIEHLPGFIHDVRWFIRNRPDLVGQACYMERRGRPAAARAVDRRPSSTDAAASAHLGRVGVPLGRRDPQPVEVSRAQSVQLRRRHGVLRAGGSGRQDQGRQLELARTDLVPDVVPADRVADEVRRGARARVRDGDAGRRCDTARPSRDGAPDRGPHDRAVHARREDGSRRIYGGTATFQQNAHWRDLPAVQRVLPRRQRRRARRQPSDRMDGTRRQPDRRMAAVSCFSASSLRS